MAHIAVVGGSLAGLRAVETLRTDGFTGEITVVNAEDTAPYDRPPLSKKFLSGEWEAEITGGEFFDSFLRKQVLQFTANTVAAAASPNGEKAPVLVTDISPNDVKSAISMTNKAGKCNVVFTVGTDGAPKDIKPNCENRELNPRISAAVKKMKYEPGMKGGKAVDWPNVSVPLNLGG